MWTLAKPDRMVQVARRATRTHHTPPPHSTSWAKKTPSKGDSDAVVAQLLAKMAAKKKLSNESSTDHSPADTPTCTVTPSTSLNDMSMASSPPASPTNGPVVRLCNLQGQSVKRTIGQVTGQSLLFENFKQCKVVIADSQDEVSLVNCTDCTVFLGPTRNTVTVSACKNLVLSCITSHLTVTNSERCQIAAYAATSPVVEDSLHIELSRNATPCPALSKLFHDAGHSPQAPDMCAKPVTSCGESAQGVAYLEVC